MTDQPNDGISVAVRGALRWRVRRAVIERAVRMTIAEAAPHVRGELTVVLTGDREIRALNREYRGKSSPTDVLSFEIGDGCAIGEPFGDVVVSVETAKRQANEYGAPIETELARLVVHGTLHLCGYDHHARRDAVRMHGLTRKLVRRLAD